MRETLYATFDGARLVADAKLNLPANTRLRVIVETLDEKAESVYPDVDWFDEYDEYLWQRHDHPVH